MSIRGAQLARPPAPGVVYAIEPEPADVALIQANAEAFAVPTISGLVAGRGSRKVLATLLADEPDAVFVGGTGRQVVLVLKAQPTPGLATGGRMVVNDATIDGLANAHETLKRLAGEVQVWNVLIARGIEQMDRVRFEGANPSFLLAVTKTAEAGD